MSSIDPSAAQTALFEKLGISKNTDAQKANSDSLGQSDFLKLMTTQLQNQDPFAPMDNGDFIAQMAQFSTVTGIEEVNSSLKTLVEKFDQGRIATATNLLGHSVLVPGNISRPDENGEVHGV
ncbi:flagellar biosynthesis protein FlgJ, partial [bacterium]|nr:flagellar biosynthesis protein FlgJ [bacterium]